MRNFASTLVKFSKLSHFQTTIWRPLRCPPPPHCGVTGALCYATAGVPTLEKPDGSGTASASESAEVLADAFSSVYVHEPEGLPDVGMPIPPDHILTDIFINHDNVKYELERLNCFKSFGPDGIHPKLLKSLANDFEFVEAVVILFRACTDTVTIPKVWKSANVSALFKNGSKTEPLNYRPVSLTCVIC